VSRTPDHISEQELVLAANGELSPARAVAVSRHVESCSQCCARLSAFEAALGEYLDAYHEELDARVPDGAPARRNLSQRLEAVSTSRPQRFDKVWAAIAAGALAAALGGIALLQPFTAEPSRFAPDASLTPGLTRPVTAAELCAADTDEAAPTVSRSVALEVFRRHGIANPAAGAYELDYLIPPDLGGARDDRNLWPQPYQEAPWNAYAKDALEDRLRRLVCGGKLDLRVAQEEIANDWTVAYRKYFETNEPLVSHATFLKDTPWQ
jgi:hypothetical protein